MLKRRLRAWWNGYDPDVAPVRRGTRIRETDGEDTSGEADRAAAGWTAERRALAEAVWTPGFIVPGGTAYVEELVNGCGLTAAETLLEIGVGMGGGTRTIIARFGNYVTGYEPDAALAEEARRQAVTHDMEGKLEVFSVPFDEFKVRTGFFRAALLRDVLFAEEDKCGLLEKVCVGLKAGESHVVITDFVRAAEADSEALAAWERGEPGGARAWSLEELVSCLKKCRVKIRMEEDQSERYCQMVSAAWADYLATLKDKEVSEEFGRQVMEEAAYWTRRVAAIETGALRYVVVKAVKAS